MPKVYVFVQNQSGPVHAGLVSHVEDGGDVYTLAMAEDGCVLSGHLSSSVEWARHDMGITSNWKHDKYQAHYPNGYEVEWVESPLEHEGLQAAYALNQALASSEYRRLGDEDVQGAPSHPCGS